MSILNKLIPTLPEFDPPLTEGDYILYRRTGFLKPYVCKPRIGRIIGIVDEGLYLDVDYPTIEGGNSEIISVFQIIENYSMGEDNESESDLS